MKGWRPDTMCFSKEIPGDWTGRVQIPRWELGPKDTGRSRATSWDKNGRSLRGTALWFLSNPVESETNPARPAGALWSRVPLTEGSRTWGQSLIGLMLRLWNDKRPPAHFWLTIPQRSCWRRTSFSGQLSCAVSAHRHQNSAKVPYCKLYRYHLSNSSLSKLCLVGSHTHSVSFSWIGLR